MTGQGGLSGDASGGGPASPPVQIGAILAGKYRVERVLGVGAMGVVVAATHVDLLELRAIKLMLPSMLGDREGVERFLREARAVSKLRSRHVAAVFDVGRLENGAPYIVMEHLEGMDLKSVLEQRGVLSVGEAAAYVSEACEALAEAHAAGIVHRDLKPANLFVVRRHDAAPTIKVLDFGIAKMAVAPDSGAAMEMTSTRQVLGTPLYMAPEQMRAMRNADARSDVWSLGVILYRALTGKVPFHGDALTEVCMAVLSDTPALPSTLRPDLPRGLDAVILRCLEKDPARRIGSAAELAMALAPFVPVAGRPFLASTTAERAAPVDASPTFAGDATNAATLVWKPSGAESPDKTASRASWAQTASRTSPPARRSRLLGAIGLGIVAVGVAVGVELRSLARPGNPPSLAAAEVPSVPVPSASVALPSVPVATAAPVSSANEPPAPAAIPRATTKVAPAPAPRSKPAIAAAAPRESAAAKPPPALPTGTFGDGRY